MLRTWSWVALCAVGCASAPVGAGTMVDVTRPDGSSGPDASSGDAVVDPADPEPSGPCLAATELWREDFESGDHRLWTGRGYGAEWGDRCQSTTVSTEHPHGGSRAQRSEIVCRSPSDVHRGYGGLQWSGDRVAPEYTNTGVGLDAPHGIVTTFHSWLEAPYAFADGRWVSLFTIQPTCGYTERAITLGLDQADGILRPAHYWPEGVLTTPRDAPAMPRGRWVRITVYLDLHRGEMRVWQDGKSVAEVTGIARTTRTMCQWHWGLYASGDNTDVVLYEDDKVVWKLGEPLPAGAPEPWLGETQAVCD